MARLRPFVLLVLLCFFALPAQAQLPDFTALIDQYADAVVSISAVSEEKASGLSQIPVPEDSPFYEYFKKFFEEIPHGAPIEQRIAMGSGFVMSPDGYILTNAHVIQDAQNVKVTLHDRREFKARVVGSDKRSDVAVVKIEGHDLPVCKIGDSAKLKVGQWVLAIGSPFGLDYTATQGIVSALGRSLPSDTYVPFIQTDAAINPGNSGGPLFNLSGEVIGVNAQIYSQTGGYMGVSFAIPINVAIEVADQLKTRGKVSRGWLGVVVQEVTPDLAKSFGLDRARGALVADVVPKGPAAEAGLAPGDIIVSFNGQPVERSSDLPPLVGHARAGTRVPMVYMRGGKEHRVDIAVAELPEEKPAATTEKAPPKAGRLNMAVAPTPPDSEVKGALVQQVGPGPAATAGIQAGDIITRVDDKDITSPDQLAKVIDSLQPGKSIPILLQRQGQPLFLALTLPEK